MNGHHTVVDLAQVAIPLAGGAHRLMATLARAGLVNATDRLAMGMLFGHDLLTSVPQQFFIPFDRFEESL